MNQIKQNQRRRAIRRGLVALLLLIAIAAFALFVTASRNKPPEVRTAILEKGDITRILYLTAQIQPGAIQESYASGQKVQAVHVSLGDSVREGDRLVTFDCSTLNEQLEEARQYRMEAEQALETLVQSTQEQADESREALSDLQKQIGRLSNNLSGSVHALDQLTGISPYEIEIDEEQRDELTEKIIAIDPDAPDAAEQYQALISEYSDVVDIHVSDDYVYQINRLQNNLSGADISMANLTRMIADPDLFEALASQSTLTAQSDLIMSAQSVLAQAVQAELMAEKAREEAVEYITADFDGIVAALDVKAGDEMGSGSAGAINGSFPVDISQSASGLTGQKTRVLVLYDYSQPTVRYLANRYDAALIEVGMPVVYHWDEHIFHGRVTYKSRFSTGLDPSSASAGTLFDSMNSVAGMTAEPVLSVEMSLNGEAIEQLVLGFNIDAEIETASAQDVLLLPAEAMRRELDTYFVFTLDEESQLVKQIIQPGIQSDTYIEVLDGLDPGARVVLNPGYDLEPGTKVVENEG
jgi:HlyD family secretion protein